MISTAVPFKTKMPKSGQNEGVTAYVPPHIKRKLEEWADREERSVSWLVGKLIEEAVKDWEQKEQSSKGEQC